jgi:hypothetical protein
MSDIQEEMKRQYKRAKENDIDTYKIYRKIQEQAKVYEEYNNFDREDLIDELEEEKRINEKDLEEINRLNNIIDELEKYIKTEAKVELYGDGTGFRTFADVNDILNKLDILKGVNK